MNQLTKLVSVLCLLAVSGCSKTESINIVELGEVNNCDSAQQSCLYSSNGLNASLQLGDGSGVGELKPFDVQFLINSDPEEVKLSFIMPDMDMGPNLYRMKKVGEQWTARPMLPICSASRLDWTAEVQWKIGNNQFKLAFPFHTDGMK